MVDESRKEIISLLSDLVKAKSVNPPGNTKAASQVLIKKFKQFGMKANIAALDSDKPNIIAEINPDNRPQLVFNSHIDTVPVARARYRERCMEEVSRTQKPALQQWLWLLKYYLKVELDLMGL